MLFMGATFAGCTNPVEESAQSADATTTAIQAPGHSIFRLETCHGTEMNTAVAADWARPFIHDDFEPRSRAPNLMDVFVRVVDCERLVLQNEVLQDVVWMDAMIAGYQSFDQDSPGGTSVVVDTFVTSPVLGEALTQLNITNHAASVERLYGPAGLNAPLAGWRITGPDFSFTIELPESGTEAGRIQLEGATWYPGPPHTRRLINLDETLALMMAGSTIAMEGTTRMNQLFGNNDIWHSRHQSRWESDYTYTFEGGFPK